MKNQRGPSQLHTEQNQDPKSSGLRPKPRPPSCLLFLVPLGQSLEERTQRSSSTGLSRKFQRGQQCSGELGGWS